MAQTNLSVCPKPYLYNQGPYNADMLLFWLRSEFLAAGAHMRDSSGLNILQYFFFFSIEIISLVTLKKIGCNNILHSSLLCAPIDQLHFIIS